MNWFYASEEKQLGPVSDSELQALVDRGAVVADTLVWHDGLPNWQPFSTVRNELAPATTVSPEQRVRCVECGGTFPATEVANVGGTVVCATCKPVFLQKLLEGAPVGGAGMMWRSKRQLVVALDAPFPDRCVKCDAPAAGRRLKRALYWHHPALYVLIIFPGLLIYVLVALVARKKAKFDVGICELHASARKRAILISWLVMLAGVIGIGATVSYEAPYFIIAAIAVIIAGAIYGIVGSRVVFARKIDRTHAFLGGAGESFLAELPEWTGRRA